ncbi:hypothetical protein ACVWY0_003544 [Arthrobacter sp. UYNi723]
MTPGIDRKTDRINPDSMATLWLTVCLVGFLAVASFMVSFTGLHEVAAWAGLPVWLRWAVPVFIDVAILAYTLAVLIHRHRGERTWASWISLGGFTVFSMVANAAHALSIPHPDFGQQIIGAAIASLAPLAVFAATEQLGRLVIGRPDAGEPAAKLTVGSVGTAPDGPGSGGEPLPEAEVAHVPATWLAAESTAGEAVRASLPVTQDEPAVPVPVGAATAPSTESVPAVPAETSSDGLTSHVAPVPALNVSPRPSLSVVGRKPKAMDLEQWVGAQLSAGTQPTGKAAAKFLNVSERTGRTRLNDLKATQPALFAGAVLKEGTNA